MSKDEALIFKETSNADVKNHLNDAVASSPKGSDGHPASHTEDEKNNSADIDHNNYSSDSFVDEGLIEEKEILGFAAKEVEDDSPYVEVRAAVPSTDNYDLPQNTIRVWVIGFIMTTIGSAMNMLFSMHAPTFSLSSFVTSMIAWPIGKLWARCVPDVRLFGKYGGPRLNPGPFNLKEHAVVTIMGNIAFGSGAAYATDILLAMNIPHFYNIDFGWGFGLLAIWSTQCLGFSLAGLCHKVLVEPASMVWPSSLVTCTFLGNMHIETNMPANGWKISRLRFFMFLMVGLIIWNWLPAYLFPALSAISIPVFAAPNNVIVNQIFGPYSGMGLFPLTLDWNMIAGYIGSPLLPPVSALSTIGVSMILIFLCVLPIIHYSNVWYGNYLPISMADTFDRFQQPYNVTKITTSDASLDLEAYKAYSPLYLPTTFAISYGLSFAAIASTITHTFLFHGKDIWFKLKSMSAEKQDVHGRLMKQYKPVPQYWYLILFVVFTGLSIVTIAAWKTHMPIWSLLFAIFVAAFFLLPVGIIYAMTNISIGLNVITELLIGYMVPGKPIAMMFFKTFGYISNSQAITFAQDMKTGHYLKIKPKLLFTAQFLATLWGSVVQLCVLRWAEKNIDGLCTHTQPGKFTCSAPRVFFNASIIWGIIGPKRMFGSGALYSGLNYFFLIGAIMPVINWLIIKYWPKRLEKYGKLPKFIASTIHWPVFFSGTGLIPPATAFNYMTYCLVGLGVGYFVRRYYFQWWAKYNYTMSAGLDVGLAISTLIIFFAVTLHNVKAPQWWGVTAASNNLDAEGTAFHTMLEKGQTFGVDSW